MAGTVPAVYGTAPAQSDVLLLARIRGGNGNYVTQASISSISATVTNLSTGVVIGSTGLTVASVIFDSLQVNDPRWTQDSTGYNFLAVIPAGQFAVSTPTPTAIDPVPQPPQQFQIDVVFTPVSGGPFRVVWRVTPIPVYA